ncbi:hypothetical protein ACLK2C_10075 [Escherichia coli]
MQPGQQIRSLYAAVAEYSAWVSHERWKLAGGVQPKQPDDVGA